MTMRTVEMSLATPGLDREGRPTRLPLGVERASDTFDEDFGAEHMLVNIGPQHPATHGVLRLVLELEGETVQRCIPHVGYLHSGFEKLGEYRHYNQIIPLTDRTDYLSPMANNVAFALAVEKLMGLELTERCQVLRVIACEMSRIISHLVWLGTTGIDLGAYTPFLWSFQERERIYNLQEMWTGARLTTSLTRVGGLMADIPEGFEDGLREFTRTFPGTLKEVDTMFTRNAIWIGRTQGVGVLTAEEATNYSLSGPMLRASGVDYDVRKDEPYLGYETYDFDVPIGEHGDIYDRYRVRLEEMWQSNRILEQALDRLQGLRGAPINVDDPRVILPSKTARDERYGGDDLPLQAGHGRSEASGRRSATWRWRTRRVSWAPTSCPTEPPSRCAGASVHPSFINLSSLPKMCEGALLSDVIAINASVDIVMGEVDR